MRLVQTIYNTIMLLLNEFFMLRKGNNNLVIR